MLKRYVGPLDEVFVSIAGNEFGIVKNGESLVVPNELAESVGWSEHWEDVKDSKKALKSAKEPITVPLSPNDVNEPGTADEGTSDSNTAKTATNENIADNSGDKEGN
jgi:hypothetical protein